MANGTMTKKFVASLEIDSTTAEKQIKNAAKNIISSINNIGKASDKVTYFKGLVEQVGELDGELAAFKTKFGENMFNEMFGQLNSGLEKEMQNLLGVTKEQLLAIDDLYSKKSKIQQALDAVSSEKDADIKLPNKDKDQLVFLENLIAKFKEAESAKNGFEARKDTESDSYKKVVAEYITAAKQLKSAFDSDPDGDILGEKSSAYLVGVDQQDAYNRAEMALQKFYNNQKDMLLKIKSLYSSEMQGINDEINKLMSGSSGSNLGLSSPQIQDNDKLATSYEKLNTKIKEYVALWEKSEQGVKFNDDGASIDDTISEFDQLFVSLSKNEEAAEEVKRILGDLSFNDINADEGFNQLSQLLNIDQVDQLDKISSGFKTITTEAKTTSQEIQSVMYHLGNLLSKNGSMRDTFGDMPYNLTDAAEGSSLEKYGYGALGSGLFGVSDPSAFDDKTVVGSKFIQSIDLSKYNMYMADTEERAIALIDFLSKLQKFAMKGAEPNYTGFDEHLGGIDVDTLYQQAQTLFAQSDLTKEQFNSFVNEMTGLLKQAGLKFDADEGILDFTNIGDFKNTENISTRFMKMLGYQGVNVGTTQLDGLGQGSVLFDFDTSDIVGYFSTVESAIQDYQNIINQVDGKEWIGTSEQLEQYKINIDEIIAKLKEYRELSINRGMKESSATIQQVDESLSRLGQIRNTIDSVEFGADNQAQFARITDAIVQRKQEQEIVEQTNQELKEQERIQEQLNLAAKKIGDFENLTDQLSNKSYFTNDVEVGQYIQRLDDAKVALEELGKQGLLTDSQLEDIDYRYNNAKYHLQSSADNFTGYGSYNYSYEYEYEVAQDENERLREENDELREQLNRKMTESNVANKQADASAEIQQLEMLEQKIKAVTEAVEVKTQAFKDEESAVSSVVTSELSALQKLLDILEEVINKVKLVDDVFKQVNDNAIKQTDNGNSLSSISTPSNLIPDSTNNKYALDSTLSNTNSILGQILSVIKNDEDTSKLVTELSGAVSELKNVANGVVDRQKLTEVDASERINTPDKRAYLSGVAAKAVNANNPDDVSIEKIYAAADGLVAVSGAVKNAEGVWEGFALRINDADQAVETSAKKHSTYAKKLNEEAAATESATNAMKVAKDAAKGPSITAAQKKYDILTNAANKYVGDDQPIYSSKVESALQEYINAFQALKSAKEAVANAKDDDLENETAKFNIASDACKQYANALEGLLKQSSKFSMSHSNVTDISKDTYNLDDIESRKQALIDYVNATYQGEAKIQGFDDALNGLNFTVKKTDGSLQDMRAELDATGTAIGTVTSKARKETSLLSSLFGGIGKEITKLSRYFIARFGIEEVIQVMRQGITYIRDIDSALTELKKVTNETDASYDRFLQTMSKTAGIIGSTVAELTTMAAEWARLGYSMQEAADLAESTAILLNVSEFEDATQASEALISTIQAFGYAAEESMDVVDILNEVGNNYAVSSDGIATALQDSASALMAGGNSMEEATAMIAAANRVVKIVPRCYSNIAA